MFRAKYRLCLDESDVDDNVDPAYEELNSYASPYTGAINTGMKSKRDDIEVHCHCRMPELKGVPMIECSKCSNLFHVNCEVVPNDILKDSLADWYRKDCQ